jgi:hypothetical protein
MIPNAAFQRALLFVIRCKSFISGNFCMKPLKNKREEEEDKRK